MTFELDKDHVYRRDGNVVPGVTSVLKEAGIITSPPVADPYYLERGQALHAAVALDLRGDLDESTVHEDVRPFLDRARRVIETLKFQPILIEQPMYDEINATGGTPDAAGSSVLGLLLPDWKCGASQPGYRVQVGGAYYGMLRQRSNFERLGLTFKDVATIKPCVISLTNEKPAPEWINATEHRHLFNVYSAAVTCYRYRRAEGIMK